MIRKTVFKFNYRTGNAFRLKPKSLQELYGGMVIGEHKGLDTVKVIFGKNSRNKTFQCFKSITLSLKFRQKFISEDT